MDNPQRVESGAPVIANPADSGAQLERGHQLASPATDGADGSEAIRILERTKSGNIGWPEVGAEAAAGLIAPDSPGSTRRARFVGVPRRAREYWLDMAVPRPTRSAQEPVPAADELVTRPPGRTTVDPSTCVVVHRRKDGGVIAIPGLDGWQADVRFRGRRSGFIVRIRREGSENVMRTAYTSAGIGWPEARAEAAAMLAAIDPDAEDA
jgi:hypothetical protein